MQCSMSLTFVNKIFGYTHQDFKYMVPRIFSAGFCSLGVPP